MPIINIQLMEGRPPEKIKSLIVKVTDAVAEELNSPKDRIRVLVSEVPKTHWGIGGVPASDIPNR
ncbi:4-oxalocrotonate tautomerase [Cohnella candidum]|uniref:Tautomerase n=1 Tax=Cohnella candidum TaxID=2674991 RepID=A0A3G3JTQ1_9BACL|nr:4-oxalocrotonate tautomerase [Cohnella candidum]AYQ71574.1 4-oxalocrotonate tautomerase [Cohnella candidum]